MPSRLPTSVLQVLPSSPFSVSPSLPPLTASQRPPPQPSCPGHPCSRCCPSLPPARRPGYSVTAAKTMACGSPVNTGHCRHTTRAARLVIVTPSPPCHHRQSRTAALAPLFCEPVQRRPPCHYHAAVLVTSPLPRVPPSPTLPSPPTPFGTSPPPDGGGGGRSPVFSRAVFRDCVGGAALQPGQEETCRTGTVPVGSLAAHPPAPGGRSRALVWHLTQDKVVHSLWIKSGGTCGSQARKCQAFHTTVILPH